MLFLTITQVYLGSVWKTFQSSKLAKSPGVLVVQWLEIAIVLQNSKNWRKKEELKSRQSLSLQRKIWVHEWRHLCMDLLNAIVFIIEKFSFSSKSSFEFLEKICKLLETQFLKSLRSRIELRLSTLIPLTGTISIPTIASMWHCLYIQVIKHTYIHTKSHIHLTSAPLQPSQMFLTRVKGRPQHQKTVPYSLRIVCGFL